MQLNAANMDALNNWEHGVLLQSMNEDDNEAALRLVASAIVRLKHVISLDPAKETSWYNLGLAFRETAKRKPVAEREKLYQQALTYLLQTDKLQPGLAYYDLARIYALTGESEQSERLLRKWLENKANKPEIINLESDFESLRGR